MTDYYLDAAASAGGNGSESTPWNTFADAAATATVGDTVYVTAGTYNEDLAPGSGRSVTWHAVGGDVVIDGAGEVVDGIIVPASANLIFTGDSGSRWVVQNWADTGEYGVLVSSSGSITISDVPFIIKDCENGIRIANSTTVDISRLRVFGTATIPLNIDGSTVTGTIDNSIFIGGLYVRYAGGTAAKQVKLINCLIAGMINRGVWAVAGSLGRLQLHSTIVSASPKPSGANYPVDDESTNNVIERYGCLITSHPTDYTILNTGDVDGGGNIENEPIYSNQPDLGSISFNVDDSANIDSAAVIAAHGAANGYACSWALDYTGYGDAAGPDWDYVREFYAAGNDLLMHTRHACNMSTLNAMGIQYTGAAASASVTVGSGVIAGTVAGGANDFSFTLANYSAVQALVAAIDALTGWDAVTYDDTTTKIGTGSDYGDGTPDRQYTGDGIPTNLANATVADAKTAQITLEYDQTLHFAEEVGGCVADIARETGYTPTGGVFPGGHRLDAFVPELVTNGLLGCRATQGSTKDKNFLSAIEPFASEGWDLRDLWPDTLTDAQIRDSVIAFCEWVKLSGACVQLYVHGLSGVNLTQAELEARLDIVVESKVTIKKYSDQITDMRSGTADSADSPEYTRSMSDEYNAWTPTIASGSSVIEAGKGVRSGYTDIVGNSRRNPPTIGPVEYLPGIRPKASRAEANTRAASDERAASGERALA